MSSRSQFMGGLAGVALSSPLLVACGGGSASGLHVPSTLSMTDLIKKFGLNSITEKGITYHKNGTTSGTRKTMSQLYCDPYDSDGNVNLDCGDSNDDPIDYQVIGSTIGYVNSVSFQTSTDGTGFGIGAPATGAMFSSNFATVAALGANPSQNSPNCLEQTGGIIAAAGGLAAYIQQNAGQFSSAIGNAATIALNNWQKTGLGITAAAEFLGVLFATLGASTILTLLLIVGGAVILGWVAYKCFHQ